jgi:hypothetical protein
MAIVYHCQTASDDASAAAYANSHSKRSRAGRLLVDMQRVDAAVFGRANNECKMIPVNQQNGGAPKPVPVMDADAAKFQISRQDRVWRMMSNVVEGRDQGAKAS